MATTFKPSVYQQEIYNWILTGTGNATVNAVAGSGKSTTIVNALDLLPKNDTKVFLAFNKAIVEELKVKVKVPNVDIKTLHSAGFSAMMFTYKSKLNTYKYKKFLNDSLYLLSTKVTIDMPDNEQYEFRSRVIRLLDLARVEMAESVDTIEGLALKHEVDIEYDEAEVVLKLMQWGVNQFKEIDYTDMIWIPVMKKLRLKTYHWVMIDECQDLSPLQKELFLMMMDSKRGRFIAVGDKRQSINGFAGADTQSFQKIASIENTISLPLSICYRCGSKIIEEAKKIVSYIEPMEGAKEGKVETLEEVKLEDFQSGDMVLSRVTAPLISLCMKFISNGIAAYVKGREIGQNLANLVKKTKQMELEFMFEMLRNELYKLQVKIAQREKISMEEAKDEYAYIALQDKIECLHNISFGCLNTSELLNKIDILFKDNATGICCSTIHKSKGLEANRVFIIALDKLPLKRCMNVEWKVEQEMNLKYVAITRAKKELYYVDCEIKNIK